MSDVQTPEKGKTRQMSFTVLNDGTIRADFGEGIEPLTMHPASVPEAIWPNMMAAGAIRFLQGRTSSLQGDDRNPENLRSRVAKGVADLMAGTWTQERGTGTEEISIEAEAAHLYRVGKAAEKNQEYSATLAQTAEAFAALTDEQKKQLKATARFQAAYAKVKAQRAALKAEKLAKKASEDDVEF